MLLSYNITNYCTHINNITRIQLFSILLTDIDSSENVLIG
jgi:hypothetical protein